MLWTPTPINITEGDIVDNNPYVAAVARHLGVSSKKVRVLMPRRQKGKHHTPGWVTVDAPGGEVKADLMHCHGLALERHQQGQRMDQRTLTLIFRPAKFKGT